MWLIQRVLRVIWNAIANLFWLLVKLIELFAWAVSEIVPWMRQTLRQLKQAIVNRNFSFFLFPLQWLLRGIWELIVQGFWLLVKLVELIVWYLSKLNKFTPTAPESTTALPDRQVVRKLRPKTTLNQWKKPKKARRSRKPYILLVLFTLFLMAFPLAVFLPASHAFQGKLIVESLSFTYGDRSQSRRFLQEIRKIQQISVTGRQNFTLTGRFQSEDDPRLNRLTTLTVKLSTNDSQWRITPAEDNDRSQLALKELWLRQNSKVENLSYNYDSDRVSLELHPAIRPNLLELDFGADPVQVTLVNYQISELQETNNSEDRNSLTFTFIPEEKQVSLILSDRTLIDTLLTDVENSGQWFSGNLDVNRVQFYRLEKTDSDVDRDRYNSTIVSGTIRMAKRSLTIEDNQFLFGDNLETHLDIQQLRFVEIRPHASESNLPKGIELEVSGKAKKIQVASDPNFIESSIQSSILNQWVPQNVLIAFIIFWTALVSYCFYWLIDNSSKFW